MKASELIKILEDYPDFTVIFSTFEVSSAKDNSDWPTLKRFDVEVEDIGHQSKIIILGKGNEL